MGMTSKERLTRLFRGHPIDRIPIWLKFPHHPFSAYADVQSLPCYREVLAAAARYGDVFDRRRFDTGFCMSASPDIVHEREEIRRGERTIKRHTVRCRGVTLTDEFESGGEQSPEIRRFVRDIRDLDKILALPYVPPEPDVSRFFVEEKELGDRGLMMASQGDPLSVLHNLCSTEDLAVWSLTEMPALLRFLDVMYERCLRLYTYLLDRGVGPVYYIVGTEFAGPPMVSPKSFEELSVRHVKGIVDLIRSRGMWSIIHYHGHLKYALPGMKAMGPDGLHTIEAPPVGNCTIAEAREALGDTILIGNIQYDDLVRQSAARIEALVCDAIDQARGGRFILSPTAGPYEQHIGERMRDNYLKFMEAGIRYGKLA